MPSDPVKPFPFVFYLQINSTPGKQKRERNSKEERSHTSTGELTPPEAPRRSHTSTSSLHLSTGEIIHQHWLAASQHRRDRTPPWAPIHIQATQRNITQSPFRQTHTHLARSTPTRSRVACSTTEIAPMTHPCLISLFLDLPLPFPHLLITLSSSFSPFDQVFELWKCFVLIFVWFCFDFCLF